MCINPISDLAVVLIRQFWSRASIAREPPCSQIPVFRSGRSEDLSGFSADARVCLIIIGNSFLSDDRILPLEMVRFGLCLFALDMIVHIRRHVEQEMDQ